MCTDPTTRIVVRLVLASAFFTAGGCPKVQYVAEQAIGELAVLSRMVPIEEVLSGDTLTEQQERKLRLVVEARDFATRELGLNVGSSFKYFHDTHDRPPGYSLSAASKDSLTARQWWFPIVGILEQLTFLSRDDAERAEADLQQQGYDTYLREVEAFSTGGWLPDPAHSPLLKRSDARLVEVVVHELAHNTIYVNGRSNFNETVATFIGRTGALLFFERRGADDEQLAALRADYADQDRVNAWQAGVYASLSEYYAQDIPSGEKIAGREAVYQAARDRFVAEVLPELKEPERYRGWANLPTNNALVLLNRRYYLDLALFDAVYEHSGGDFAATLAALRAAAASDDPWAHLRSRLDAR